MATLINLLILAGASAVMAVLGRVLLRLYDGAPPLLWSVLYLIAVTAVGTVTVFPFAQGFTFVQDALTKGLGPGYGSVMTRLCLALLIYFYPLALVSHILSGLFSEMAAGFLFGSSLTTAPRTSYGKAHALAKQGAVTAAVRQFRRYFEEDMRVPAPLFSAAMLLTREKQFREAAGLYREIMEHFARNTQIWAEAGLRLAELYEHQLADKTAAADLLHAIAWRARHREHRQAAANRLMRMATATPSDNPA